MGKSCLEKIVVLGMGIGIGTCLGILLAPKSGKETRKDIGDKLSKIHQKKEEDIDYIDLKQEFSEKTKEIENDLDNLGKERVLEIAKVKAKKIQNKISELNSLADKKGNKILVKRAQHLKENAVSVIDKTLHDLERKRN